jgi:hypothetical protein
MSVNPRKRQRKLEERAAKRKAKQHQLVQRKSLGIAERLTSSARFPVLECWVTKDLWTQGMGWIGISRELPDGSIAVAIFLVDRYCLGVKDALAKILPPSTYENQIRQRQRQMSSREVLPATARKFVEGAVAYAQNLGLPPHPDYHRAKLIFGDIDAGDSTEELEFGKDGKPCFIAGPYDDAARIRRIQAALEKHLGSGGFNYAVPIGDLDELVPGPTESPELMYEPEAEPGKHEGAG